MSIRALDSTASCTHFLLNSSQHVSLKMPATLAIESPKQVDHSRPSAVIQSSSYINFKGPVDPAGPSLDDDSDAQEVVVGRCWKEAVRGLLWDLEAPVAKRLRSASAGSICRQIGHKMRHLPERGAVCSGAREPTPTEAKNQNP